MNVHVLSEDEVQFRTSVRAFVDKEIAPNAARWDVEGVYPRELFSRFGKLGWLGTPFPVEVGGSGGGSVFYAIQCAELARGSGGIALGSYVHTALACSSIFHLGSDEQKKHYLPAAFSGERVGCWGYAEPNAGADVSSVATRARKDGDDYILNGSKLYISNATFADFFVVVAATAPEKGLRGMSVFVIDRGTRGLTVGKPMPKLGMSPSEVAEIVFEDCRVPARCLVGPEEKGFIKALSVLVLGRIAAASFAVGLGRAAFEAARAYVVDRVQFGKALCEQQFVRFTLADMDMRLEASWLLTLNAARLVDAQKPHDREAPIAKLYASETGRWVAERALHLSGAQGYMLESAAQRFYRDCKVLDWGEGTSEIQREMIARHLLAEAK